MPNPSNRPRKSPKQERSAELVSAVYEACVRIFKSSKKVSFSTRSVAELAGVSVGSLYQYFPNKEALIGALIEREAQRHVNQLDKKYDSVKETSFEEIVFDLIADLLNTIEKDKKLLRGILQSIFFVERLDAVIDARESAIELICRILIEQNKSDAASAGLKAYMIVAIIGGVVETIIFRTDDSLSLAQISKETATMVVKYCDR